MTKLILLGAVHDHVPDLPTGADAVLTAGPLDGVTEQLDALPLPVYVVPDPGGLEDLDKYATVKNLQDWIADVGDVHVVGKGGMDTPEYPQEKDALIGMSVEQLYSLHQTSETMYDRVGGLVEQATKPVVLLSHIVPYGTFLEDGSGSVVLRDIIHEYSPVACVGRHNDDEAGKVDMNGTTVVNIARSGYAVVEIETGEVTRLEFRT